jgi:hypothetical protein
MGSIKLTKFFQDCVKTLIKNALVPHAADFAPEMGFDFCLWVDGIK